MKIDRLLQNTFAQTHDFRPFFMNVYEIHAESRYLGTSLPSISVLA